MVQFLPNGRVRYPWLLPSEGDYLGQLRERVWLPVKPVCEEAGTMSRSHGIVSQHGVEGRIGLEGDCVILRNSGKVIEGGHSRFPLSMHWVLQGPDCMSMATGPASHGPAGHEDLAVLDCLSNPIERAGVVYIEHDCWP